MQFERNIFSCDIKFICVYSCNLIKMYTFVLKKE